MAPQGGLKPLRTVGIETFSYNHCFGCRLHILNWCSLRNRFGAPAGVSGGSLAYQLSRSGWLVIAGITLIYLVMALHTPIWLRGRASYDDALFVRQALNLIHGDWLGAYDNLTLAKGPGYPFFLAACFGLGLPITLTQPLLYTLACMAVALAVARLTRVTWLPVLLYAVLLWHPAMLPLRVTRDSIYGSQTLLICAAVLVLVASLRQGRTRSWLALGAGVLFGWFWLTREEGVWLVPGLLVLVLGAAWVQWDERQSLRPWVFCFAWFVAGLLSMNVGNKLVNFVEYGQFTSVDFTGSSFKEALSMLQSVRDGAAIPHVPVPVKVRNDIYAASPAFKELSWYLEDKSSPGYSWRKWGCEVYPETCGDLAGGWFPWAFRNAVASRGYYRSAATADAYFRRLSGQIKAACSDGRLTCRRQWLSLMPQVGSSQWQKVPGKVLRAVGLLTFTDGRPSATIPASDMPVSGTEPFDMLLGRPLRTPFAGKGKTTLWIRGWYHAKGAQWFELKCKDGAAAPVRIKREPSGDIAAAFHDPQAERQRFQMEVDGLACPLEFSGIGTHDFDIGQVKHGKKQFLFGGAVLHVDDWRVMGEVHNPVGDWAKGFRERLIWAYGVLLPVLGGLGFFSYVLLCGLVMSRRGRDMSLCFVAATAFWCMVAARVAVVVMVDISAFPAVRQLYLMAAYPLLCLAALLSVFRLLEVMMTWRTAGVRQSSSLD